ncbi:MAG: HlyD family efflux transporter periplasmic adaptor subunit [Stellaceae bacterium]
MRARELAWQGRPVLDLGLPAMFTSLASVTLAVAFAALITLGSYARRVDMEGTILPSAGLMTISSPSSGWIAALAVREGEAVEKGALLYTLNLDIATKEGSTQQQIINAQIATREMLTQQINRKTRMSEETQKQLRQKIENLKVQIDQLGEQVTLQQGFFKTIAKEYNLFLGLVERHQASLNEMDSRQQAWMQSQSKLQELESSKLRLQGELNDAQYQLATIAISTADEIDALKTKVLDTDEKLANSEARRSIEIHAPEAGVVTAIVGHPGQVVGSGSPLLKIVPEDANMHAELLAPSSAVGFIYKGERVLLRYSAFPYQKFGEYWGTVVTVSDAALTPEEVQSLLTGAQPTKQTGPFYRVIVKPDTQLVSVYGEERKLPASMRVQAYALLDRRPLYQWILDPLYDIGRAAHGL